MSRRGSVRKHDNGTWSFTVDVSPAGAARRQVRRRGFDTRREAQAELTRLLGEIDSGRYVNRTRTRLATYLDSWMDALGTSGRSQSTVSSYRHNLRLHVIPYIGDADLQQLNAVDIDRLYARLLTSGRRNAGGGPLSNRTVRYVHTILSRALADAARKGLLSTNPAESASPPSAKSARPAEMKWWTPDELRRFLDESADHELGTLFQLIAMTGMRRGEAAGLTWPDVNLRAARLTIRQALVVTDYQLRIDIPKSERGRRTIDLDDVTVEALRDHQSIVSPPSEAVDVAGWNGDPLVFQRADGSPHHPESISTAFDGLVRSIDVRRIRLHDLRHTHVAHLIEAGVDPLTISRRLGHASVAFTLDRYGHLFEQAGPRAAAAAARLLD